MATYKELKAKSQAGTLTTAEAEELRELIAELSGDLVGARELAKSVGIYVATNEDTTQALSVFEDFTYHAEGVASWSEYRLRTTTTMYNTIAVRLKLPQCENWRELGKFLPELEKRIPAAAAEGRTKARARYRNQWTKELGKLMAMRDSERAAAN